MTYSPLMCPHQPPLEQRNDPVNPRHKIGWRLFSPRHDGCTMPVALFFQAAISLPAIRMNRAPWFNRVLNKSMKAFGRCVRYAFHADATDTFPVFLGGYNDQRFFFGFSTPQAFLQSSQIGFVDFDPATQPISSRPNHRTSKLMQQHPSGLVTASKHPFQSQSAGAVFLTGHPPHRPEPYRQRQMGILKNRPNRKRGLVATLSALQKNGSYRPVFGTCTPWTPETIRPSKSEQVFSAFFFSRKSRFKFHKCFGVIFHTPSYYI